MVRGVIPSPLMIGAGMTQAYSTDLRSRVIHAATNGMSARAAAERFGVGVSTAIVWVRRFRESGEHAARLDSGHGVRVGLTTVWKFLDRCGLTYKKRGRTRPSSSART